MSLCIDSQCEIVDKFDAAVHEVIETMIGEKVVFLGQVGIEVARLHEPMEPKGLTVVMGYSGGLQGTISISLTDVAAMAWTRGLIEHETSEVDQTVIDAVGELGNIVVGTAKRQLTSYNLSMSLPSVIRCGRKSVVFPSSAKAVRRVYKFAEHELVLTIALSAA